MQNMTVTNTLIHDRVQYDDCTLIDLYYKAQNNIKKRRRLLETRQSDKGMQDYLSVAIARIAYQIVKEEHDLLLKEINKRGLTITI